MEIFRTQFLQILQFQKSVFSRLLAIQDGKQEHIENDYHVRPEGHLVQVSCGHRGQPTRQEEKRISRLIRKSGFIPMLEDIEKHKKQNEQDFERVMEQDDYDIKYNTMKQA